MVSTVVAKIGDRRILNTYLVERRRDVTVLAHLEATGVGIVTAGVGNAAAVAAMALAFAHFGTQPAENVLIAQYTPARLRSTFYGIKFFVTFGLGAIGAPIAGLLWRTTGTFAWTFVLFAAVAVLVAIAILFLSQAGRSQHPPYDVARMHRQRA